MSLNVNLETEAPAVTLAGLDSPTASIEASQALKITRSPGVEEVPLDQAEV